MSIHPSSDLILDVVKAADPATSMAATQRLTGLAGVKEQDTGEFSIVLQSVKPVSAGAPTNVEPDRPVLDTTTQPLDKTEMAFKDLEQLVLRNLVETMLPADAESLFGHGTAGNIWKSMLADALAKDMGKTVDLGIARAASMRPNYSSSFLGAEQHLEHVIAKQKYDQGL